MAKNSYGDWDATSANNTDIGGINIAENCAAANINNAIRELMSQLVDYSIASTTDTVGRLINIQTFTASGTYTPTSGTTDARIKMVGAGGAGGGADSDTNGTEVGIGQAAGAGAYVEGYLDVSAGAYSATITIGAGGTGGDVVAGSPVDGTDGGNTVYDDGTVTWTAAGGSGGTTSQDKNSFAIAGAEGGAGTASGALVVAKGQAGGAGVASNTAIFAAGGAGGGTTFGGGGTGGTGNIDGDAETGGAGGGYGAGGGGAVTCGATASQAGGDGAGGFVIIYEYS